MMAGVDFIKVSTGKKSVNITLLFGIVISRAILSNITTKWNMEYVNVTKNCYFINFDVSGLN